MEVDGIVDYKYPIDTKYIVLFNFIETFYLDHFGRIYYTSAMSYRNFNVAKRMW